MSAKELKELVYNKYTLAVKDAAIKKKQSASFAKISYKRIPIWIVIMILTGLLFLGVGGFVGEVT